MQTEDKNDVNATCPCGEKCDCPECQCGDACNCGEKCPCTGA